MQDRSASTWLNAIAIVASAGLAIWLAILAASAPPVRQAENLDWVKQHVAQIAKEPHPLGSQANIDARDYVAETLRDLGWSVELQDTTVVYKHPTRETRNPRLADVSNVLAHLPATKTGGDKLLLMSHYDSVAWGPGAGDAASGVAATLLAARELAAMQERANDIYILITDGEEAGLYGAQAFFRQHSLAESIDLVINFEARGAGGPAMMFETSPGNAQLINLLANHGLDVRGNSLSYEVYQRMPNDTDLSISKGETVPGLNFAFIGDFAAYHHAIDAPEYLSDRSLMHHANQATALATALVNQSELGEMARAASNQTYFNIGTWLVHYPSWLMWLLFAVSVVLGALALRKMLRDSGKVVFTGLLHCTFTAVLSALAAAGIVRGIGTVWPDLPYLQVYMPGTVLGAVVAIAVAIYLGLAGSSLVGKLRVFLIAVAILIAIGAWFATGLAIISLVALVLAGAWFYWRKDNMTLAQWRFGGLAVTFVLTVIVSIAVPYGGYLFSLLLIALSLSVLLAPRAPWIGWLALAIPASLWLALIYMVHLGLGIYQPIVGIASALLFAISMSALLPRAQASRALAVVLMLVGIGLLTWGAIRLHPTERTPWRDELAVIHTEQGAWWASRWNESNWLSELPWKKADEAWLDTLGFRNTNWRIAELTNNDDLPLPRVTIVNDTTASDKRIIRMSILPVEDSQYSQITFFPADGSPPLADQILGATVDGNPISAPDNGQESWRVRYSNVTNPPFELDLTLAQDANVKWVAWSLGLGLPVSAPERPYFTNGRAYSFDGQTLNSVAGTIQPLRNEE